jgi:hypothetical protein
LRAVRFTRIGQARVTVRFPDRATTGAGACHDRPVQKYEMANALARQLNVSELTTADCDWIIEAAKRGIMVSEDEAGILIGYLLGQANISPSNCVDQVGRAVDL